MIDLEKFGNIICKERLSRNLTQSNLAQTLLVTPQAVSKWERGDSFPDIETLVQLCYEFDLHIDYLLNECFLSCKFNNEITMDNIEECLRSTHRKEAITKIMNNEVDNISIDMIFYLLNTHERLMIINKVVKEEIFIDLAEFIILLNPAERVRFIDTLFNNSERLLEIRHLLSPLEKDRYYKKEEL